MNYHTLAFTDDVKSKQTVNGSRTIYQGAEKRMYKEGLGQMEKMHIGDSDSFYMATKGNNGYPYIQHRGGPKGFLKVLDDRTLGFIDFSGNKQYISLGNLSHSKKTALILMDYAKRRRLKIYATTEVFELNERPDLIQKLTLENYDYQSERVLLFHIDAFDWNCPQHITPRFTEKQVAEQLALKDSYIKTLEMQLEALRGKNNKSAK